MENRRGISVRSLMNLYSTIVALALALGITNLLDPTRQPVPIKGELVLYFAAFFVTLLPFYHGAVQHLERIYIAGEGSHLRDGAVLADFVLLFLEGCMFLALAALLPNPQYFTWGLVFLLILDAVWGFAAHLAFTQPGRGNPEGKWALVNFATAVALVVLLVILNVYPPSAGSGPVGLPAVVVCVALLRTVIDYVLTWSSYFPPDT